MKATIRYDVFWFEVIFTALWGGFAFTNLHTVTYTMSALAYFSYGITAVVMFIGIFMLFALHPEYSNAVKNVKNKLYIFVKFIAVNVTWFAINLLPMIYTDHFDVGETGFQFLTAIFIIKIIFIVQITVILLIPILSQKSKKE